MKKLLLVIVLLVSAGAAMAQSKVAHVDSQKLLDSLPSRIDAIKKLQAFEKNGIAELQELEEDLNKAYAKYEAESNTMSPVIQKIEQEKLMRKQQTLQDREQSLNQEMQAYSNELNGPILKRVQEAVKIVAERKKLNYVIDLSTALYSEGGSDITSEVIIELKRLEGIK